MTDASSPPAHVLVIEDEEPLRFTIAHNLKKEGYLVSTAGRGDDGLRMARETPPDLILLDIMLPAVDGIQITRLLRRDTHVPILLLTALTGERDRVAGLDTGADDYVTKPFGMKELLARVRALLRRSATSTASSAHTTLTSGDIVIDLDRREALRRGHALPLKPKEFELLAFLVQHRGRIFTREQILADVWGYDFQGGPRTVDVHVRWLRQKIEDDPAKPVRLRTVRGSGYLFEG